MEYKIWLDSSKVADICYITDRAVQKAAKEGKYGDGCRYVEGKGRGGMVLQIALEVLPEEAQIEYNRRLNADGDFIPCKPVDMYNAQKREVAQKKLQAIKEYNKFIKDTKALPGKPNGRLADLFVEKWNADHPDFQISRQGLYVWQKNLKKENIAGLIDKRDAWNKGISSIPDEAKRLFNEFYFDERKLSVKQCVENTKSLLLIKGYNLNLPSDKTFERYVNSLPQATKDYWRKGITYFNDHHMPYIQRDFTSLRVNQMWVCDHHRFDEQSKLNIQVVGTDFRLYRPWITYWQDMRSRYGVSWMIYCGYPNADIVLASFARGVRKYGIPEEVLLDNGKDFRARDLFNVDDKNKINSLARQMGIVPHYTEFYHGQSKPNERTFRTFEDQFGKLWASYLGNCPQNRPEKLKKRGLEEFPTIEEFNILFSRFIDEIYNNDEHHGQGMDGRSPREVYMEGREHTQIMTASEEVLRLFLMRTTETKKIQRNGIRLLDGWYYSEEFKKINDSEVYARYDPEFPEIAYIYDTKDVFLFNAYREPDGKFGGDKEQYERLSAKKKALKQYVKSFKEPVNDIIENPWDVQSLLDAKSEKLKKNKKVVENMPPAKIVTPVRNEKIKAAAKKIKESGFDINKVETYSYNKAMEAAAKEDEKLKEAKEILNRMYGLDKVFAKNQSMG